LHRLRRVRSLAAALATLFLEVQRRETVPVGGEERAQVVLGPRDHRCERARRREKQVKSMLVTTHVQRPVAERVTHRQVELIRHCGRGQLGQ
jgi:hypothetical protein